MNPQISIAILIYNGVVLTDMTGPVDIFLHANRFNGNRYRVYTVAAANSPILSENNAVSINPAFDITNCPEPDIIVIPGIIDGQQADTAMVSWIKERVNKTKIIMSVCVGAFILAQTGLLSGKRVTTHYMTIGTLHDQYSDIHIIKNVRFVEDGNILSTGGVTSGIDGALYIVGKYDGPDIAQQTADIMVYNRDCLLPPYTILPPYYYVIYKD